MRFGVCAGPEQSAAVAGAGFEYLELGVAGHLRPEQPEAEVLPALQQALSASPLRPEAYNGLLPGDLKVVGPETDPARQARYLESAFRRASMLGGKVAVFGSGGARRIPDGWARAEAERQTAEFLTLAGTLAAPCGLTVAIEPLNVSECNFLNSVAEAAALAREVNHPAVGVLSDLYHVDHDGQSYDETRDAASLLRHVHIAGAGRRAPLADDDKFLRGYFAILKAIGYAGRISVEGSWEDLPAQVGEVRNTLLRAWETA